MHREHGAGHWVVQHGNGPSRRTAGQMVGEITARYSTRDSLPPAWPPNSPDQNLLGNLWGWLDQRLDSLGCESFNTYSKAVSQQLAVVPTAPLRSLVECVPRRMAEVIRLKGEEIKYGGGCGMGCTRAARHSTFQNERDGCPERIGPLQSDAWPLP